MQIKKYDVLKKAESLELTIPPSIITNNRKDILNFFNKNKKIITKPLYETLFFESKENVIVFKYNLVKKEDIMQFPPFFFPSFFQKYVDKDYEIRTFFIGEDFYSMAIFSQLDEKTKVDFRNYNTVKPNRTVPYKLPNNITSKLKSLMKLLGLNTGSIDLIKGADGEYYFLEVNPVGQFGMVSYPCNYYLEKKIAEFLIKHDIENG